MPIRQVGWPTDRSGRRCYWIVSAALSRSPTELGESVYKVGSPLRWAMYPSDDFTNETFSIRLPSFEVTVTSVVELEKPESAKPLAERSRSFEIRSLTLPASNFLPLDHQSSSPAVPRVRKYDLLPLWTSILFGVVNPKAKSDLLRKPFRS